MTTSDRAFDRGTRRGEHLIRELGDEFREARVAASLTQQWVADSAQIARSFYSRIERGKVAHLSIVTAARICAILGLDLWLRSYPGGRSLRDAPQAARLGRILDNARPPLVIRTEVPLPQRPNMPPEQRAWDADLRGSGERTAIELEMRIRDAQALERRIALKLRDDPVDHFLLVVADTRTNRRALAEHPSQLMGLSRLRTATILKLLESGRHPPSGIILI